jgi:NADH-quinone oxidoreductase subunit M
VLDNNMIGFPILSVMVFLPVVTALVLLFIRNNRTIQLVAAAGAAVTLVISVVALVLYISVYFNAGIGQMQSFDFQENFRWLGPPLEIHYHLGADAISILLLVLTTLLTLISILVSWDPIKTRVREY